MRYALLSLIPLFTLTAHAQRVQLPTLNAYAACKYFVAEDRLNCIKASGNEAPKDWPLNLAGEPANRARAVKRAMRAVGFSVYSETPAVVGFSHEAEAGD